MDLFSVDLDEVDYVEQVEEPKPAQPKRKLKYGRRFPLSAKFLGRCTRCGAVYTDEFDYCPHCLNQDYCDCPECAGNGFMHFLNLQEIYETEHKSYEDWIESMRKYGKTHKQIENGYEYAMYWDSIYIEKHLAKAEEFRAKPCPLGKVRV